MNKMLIQIQSIRCQWCRLSVYFRIFCWSHYSWGYKLNLNWNIHASFFLLSISMCVCFRFLRQIKLNLFFPIRLIDKLIEVLSLPLIQFSHLWWILCYLRLVYHTENKRLLMRDLPKKKKFFTIITDDYFHIIYLNQFTQN
jgi:hypothetical protein